MSSEELMGGDPNRFDAVQDALDQDIPMREYAVWAVRLAGMAVLVGGQLVVGAGMELRDKIRDKGAMVVDEVISALDAK